MPTISYPHAEQIMPAIARNMCTSSKNVRAIAHTAIALSEAAVASKLIFLRQDPGECERDFPEFETGNEHLDTLLETMAPFTLSLPDEKTSDEMFDLITKHSTTDGEGSYTMVAYADGRIGITSSGMSYFEIDGAQVRVYARDASSSMIQTLITQPKEAVMQDQELGNGAIAYLGTARQRLVEDEFARHERSKSWVIKAKDHNEAEDLLRKAAEDSFGGRIPGMHVLTCEVEFD